MRKFDIEKLNRLHTAGEHLDNKYGAEGSQSRQRFKDEAMAWYYGSILRDRRKELKITQKEIADKVGVARTYISRVENGQADIQLSSFMRIASALGIEFTPTFVAV